MQQQVHLNVDLFQMTGKDELRELEKLPETYDEFLAFNFEEYFVKNAINNHIKNIYQGRPYDELVMFLGFEDLTPYKKPYVMVVPQMSLDYYVIASFQERRFNIFKSNNLDISNSCYLTMPLGLNILIHRISSSNRFNILKIEWVKKRSLDEQFEGLSIKRQKTKD